MFYFILSAFLLLSGCTISVSQVHTEGIASDVIDENQAATADVKADATIPIKGI